MELNSPLSLLSRVGATTLSKLRRLGLSTAEDLLYYFPARYEDYSRLAPIKTLREGDVVTVVGTLELIANRRTPRKRAMITEALLSDETGSIRVVWFNQPFITQLMHPGDKVYLSGTVKRDMLGPQLVSPAYEKVSEEESTHTARLVPMYSLTEGLTQKLIRSLVKQILPLAKSIDEWLPEKVLESYDLAPISSALEGIHFPKDEHDLEASTGRLKFDELFLLQLQAELARLSKVQHPAPIITFKEAEIKAFVARLPFPLTKAQKVAAWEILQDIAKPSSMNRLLSGDVGSGKTVVAALALYNTSLTGYQGVIMAPTEILAKQHFDSLMNLFGKELPVALLTGSESLISNNELKSTSKTGKRKEIVEKIQKGEVAIIVGTHALLSEGVDFKKVGLVVVDEQHRFGVAQRRVIKEKGDGVHFLSMTATPIPRSLALMIYGDLDVSVINEMPVGRKQIITRLVEPSRREKAYQFIRDQVKTGRQVFVVCPLIEETSNKKQETSVAEKKSVLGEYEKLSKKIFPDLRVTYLHGKMPAKEKDEIMERFRNKEFDILISTSVIEVGVNIPNASVMMIEGAERFGLAQLHQFRGRVGRSSYQSYCILFTDSDSTRAKERLEYFEAHHDGFRLAEKDLEIRGPGEVYGTLQSGMMQLRIAKLTDQEAIKKARDAARAIAPELDSYPAIRQYLKRWEREVHLE